MPAVLSRPQAVGCDDSMTAGAGSLVGVPAPLYSNRPMNAASASATTPAAMAAQRIAQPNERRRCHRHDPDRCKRMLALGRPGSRRGCFMSGVAGGRWPGAQPLSDTASSRGLLPQLRQGVARLSRRIETLFIELQRALEPLAKKTRTCTTLSSSS